MTLPDMQLLVKIGAVKLPPAKPNPRIKHPALAALGSDTAEYRTAWTRMRRGKLRAAGLSARGLPRKPGGSASRYGIDWKAIGHTAGMREWRRLRQQG